MSVKPEITDEDVYRAAFKKADDELTTLRTRLQQVESERDEARVARDFAELACQRKEADAEVMRGALDLTRAFFKVGRAGIMTLSQEDSTEVYESVTNALATNAGKPLLERLKEAEWLLLHSNDLPKPDGWFDRRDTFLNPTNKDVK